MGVPKFFRYISERYPCLSEFVKEYQIPEFDNLYLDMNGIIHVCSHPDDNNPHFRMAEEKMIQDIFHYIEILFRMIKPQKVFFMAIDGVAPRAKMNQQRSRRFRSAKDAEKMEAKAREKGEDLPSDARFDSNCITPGTVFMGRLQDQLKYFIVSKISTDPLWRKCKVILSGHETPGEGEHKIMDYIRYTRSQAGYDPNTRHCLYGLDADLIMLGLCTHEPHFSLLREEVLFGRQNTKRKNIPEQITFFLLHLSLMREYLELEFIPMKAKLPFKFDIEKIIDDWVLMGFLVGNDFIPHLPNLHISNGALPILYAAYMTVLPTLDGYINEGGTLNLGRFQKYMESLSGMDVEHFSEQYADLKYFESKTGRRPDDQERTSYKPKELQEWEPDSDAAGNVEALEAEPEARKPMRSDLASLIEATDNMFLESASGDADDAPEGGEGSEPKSEDDLFNDEFLLHKKNYYMNKLEFEQVTPEVLRSQAEGYVRAIQWNLHYYYNGVCSWSWFYPHHYAPYISDIKDFSEAAIEFDLGQPFKPYEQLLAVLPTASRDLLPTSYHALMTEETSVLKRFYPQDFSTDLNGKRQEWEAVVLVPFIEEKILLEAMEPCNMLLTADETRRNTHGPMLIYSYTENDLGPFEAPDYFPTIGNNYAECVPLRMEDIRVPQEKLVKGAYPNVRMDVYYPGFPTMKHLKYTGRLEKAKVKVFETASRGDNMLLKLAEEPTEALDVIARSLLGKTVFVAWPHLVEAKVVSVSNKEHRYHTTGVMGKYNVEENRGNLEQLWHAELNGVLEHYKDKLGVIVGRTDVLVHVKVMTGRKYVFTPQGRVTFEKQWSDIMSVYPIHTVVKDVSAFTKEFTAYKDIETIFPKGSCCFMLGQPHYGATGKVLDSVESLKKGRVKVELQVREEPNFMAVYAFEKDIKVKYVPQHVAATKLAISRNLFSKVTGTILVLSDSSKDFVMEGASKVNVGLNLKFNKKNEEVPGYTRKSATTWLYSEKAINLVKLYMEFCPELFEYLNSHLTIDVCFENEVFPNGDAKEKLKAITNWINAQDSSNVERQQCGTWTLEPDVVAKLEQVLDEYLMRGSMGKRVVMQVKPHLLFKGALQIGNILPDPNTVFHLYDRVVNIRESYTVPVGHVGTIVAIHKTPTTKKNDVMYDVLFDVQFAGGLSLNSSANRAYRLPGAALVNRSFGQRQLEEKAGKSVSGQLMQNMQPPPHKTQGMQGQPLYQLPNFTNSAFVSWTNQSNKPSYGSPGRSFADWAPSANPPCTVKVPQKPLPQQKCAFPTSKTQQQNTFMPAFAVEQPEVPIRVQYDEFVETVMKSWPAHADAIQQLLPKVNAQKKSPSKQVRDVSTTYQSTQLVQYFQSRGFGIPRYMYFALPENRHQAQIIMPDGQVVFGNSDRTQEGARENVAEKVLDILTAGKSPEGLLSKVPPTVKFPIPPKQWCQTNRSPPQQKTSNAQVPKPSDIATMKTTPDLTRSIFVPLQAVKQQMSKCGPSSASRTSCATKETTTSTTRAEQRNVEDGNPKRSPKTPVTSAEELLPKARRERKVRIAANFTNAIQS